MGYGVTVHCLHFYLCADDFINNPAIVFQDPTFTKCSNFNTWRSKAYNAGFTSCVAPASHPTVVPWFKVDLLARQAGIADEVTGLDVCGSFNQCDVIVQLTVGWITKALMPVDPLHWENTFSGLCSFQLMLTQNNTPVTSILCFSSGQWRAQKKGT